MVLRASRPLSLVLLGLTSTSLAVSGQDRAEPPKPLYGQLFPRPTGHNGYEELVMAGDLEAAAAARLDLNAPDMTMSQRRQALAEVDRRRALQLVHEGLAKPVLSPRSEVTFESTFPELARMRGLGRLMAANIRVCFADGRTRDAIACLRDGLALTVALHGEAVIGGLVSKAIEAVLLNTFARHLDQLAAGDCDRLVELAREWARLPDPTVAAIEAELRGELSSLDLLRRRGAGAADTLRGWIGEGGYGGILGQADTDRMLHNSASLAKTLDEVGEMVTRYHQQILLELRRPSWDHHVAEFKSDGSVAGEIADLFIPNLSSVASRFTESRARMLLLGVHAAIRRYRWENGRLPGSLDELKLGEIAMDPCSGKPFAYRVTGPSTYELSSGGMQPRNGGERTPILLPPRPELDATNG